VTIVGGVRLRAAMLVGALAGVGAGLVFATAHAFIIVPIWNRMLGGLAWAGVVGAVAGWTYTELYPEERAAGAGLSAAAGARYGALLWLAVAPVTLVDAALRAVGFLPRYELIGVGIAVALAVAMGCLLGWYRTRRRRGMVAGAAAALLLTFAMAGPVPIARSPRSLGIFLAVLPASIIAGAIVATAISLARRRRSPVDIPGLGARMR
jgi:hypothetical protein